MKNVAYIQDIGLLTKEQIKKYMGNIKNLTSEDAVKIYKFIVCCNKCYKITNFCLNINGQSLKDVSDLIIKNHKLDNCIFIATRSNVDKIQAEVTKNIFFSLSPLSVVMSDYSDIKPNNVMTIASDRNNVYYNQIFNTGPEPKYRISELTVEKVNNFVDNGNDLELLIALRNDEFEQLNKILLDPECKFKNYATFIELDKQDLLFTNKLKEKLVNIYNISSNVCLLGLTQNYENINSFTLYDNCAIQLTNLYHQWKYFIRKNIVFNFLSNSSIKNQENKNENYFGVLRFATTA
jgi:hypothetical protein